MASSYDNDLRLEEQASGENATSWGDKTNNNLELIAEAFSYGTEAITTNADTHSTTIADGGTDPGRSLYLKYTGTLDSTCTVSLLPNTVSKVWIIENATSGGFDLSIKQGSGAEITIPNGDVKIVYSDGAGSGAAIFDAFTDLNVSSFKIDKNDDGSSAAPTLTLNRTSASPADTDYGGIINFDMENDNNQQFTAANINVQALDVSDGTEDAQLHIQTMKAGTVTTATTITNLGNVLLPTDGASIYFGADSDVSLIHSADSGLTLSAGANATQLSLTSTDAGATVAPTINLTRDSGSPADNDQLGYINFVGDDSGGNQTSYAQMYAVVTDVTDTEEDSEFYINTVKAGSAANNLIVRNDSVAFKVNNTVTNNQGFAQNTAMLFYQSSAPTGWTISTANNDKALRVVSSSGGSASGSVAFSTAFASKSVSGTVGSTTLAISQIPSHNHTIRGNTVASGGAAFSASNGAGTSTGSTGGGATHTHTFSGTAINLAVQYCDVMICVKDA